MFKSKVRAIMSFSTLVLALILFSPLFAKFKNSSIEVFKSSRFTIRSLRSFIPLVKSIASFYKSSMSSIIAFLATSVAVFRQSGKVS